MKIGDRVEIKGYDGGFIVPLSQGTIVYLNVNCPTKNIHSVQWDIKPKFGHDCNGFATDKKGYNVASEYLQVIKELQGTSLQQAIELEVSKLTES